MSSALYKSGLGKADSTKQVDCAAIGVFNRYMTDFRKDPLLKDLTAT
jgi:hypothetical protein